MDLLKSILFWSVLFLVAMPASGTTVSGFVRHEGEALPGVLVSMDSSEGTQRAVIHVDGRYSLECPTGLTCTLAAELEGMKSYARVICVETRTVELDIDMELLVRTTCIGACSETPLPETKTVSGKVVDFRGAPFPNALVTINQDPYRGCRFGIDGEIEVAELIPARRTQVTTDKHGTFLVMLDVIGGFTVTASSTSMQSDVREVAAPASDSEIRLLLLPNCP